MISVDKFYNDKLKVEKFISKRAFCSRMLFQMIINEKFADEINNYIEFFNKKMFDSKKIDEILNEINAKTIKYYEKARNESKNKLKNILMSLAYFYFLESVDEHSSFSVALQEEIKKKYGEDKYLDIISKVDRIYLSKDVKNIIQQSKENIDLNCQLIATYLVLKKFQDSQHDFFEGGYGEFTEEVQRRYCKNNTATPFDIEFLTLRKFLFKIMRKNKILSLEQVSLLCGLYIKKYVIKLVGGKMFGLGMLNLHAIKVPFTVCIPTNTKLKNEDLSFLESKCTKFSVRSSADIEDGEENSFAGMFDSFLDVKFEDLPKAIHNVKNSVNNSRLRAYIKETKIDKPHMAVVIQEYVEPEYSGVWIGNDKNDGILEWVKGSGEKLVSGVCTPVSEVWNKKQCEGSYLKSDNEVSIGEQLVCFQNKLNAIADFEWMILNGKLIMLQYRPVTRKIKIETIKPEENIEVSIKGTPASSGIVESKFYIADDYTKKIQTDKILVAYATDPNWIPHIIKSKGVVTVTGGFLCHAAIICRELGIPCVTGIGNEGLDVLNNNMGKVLTLNGNYGIIAVRGNSNV